MVYVIDYEIWIGNKDIEDYQQVDKIDLKEKEVSFESIEKVNIDVVIEDHD